MKLFGNLFGGKKEADPAAAQFDAEWERALLRFRNDTGMSDLKFGLVHPKTGETMTPHEGLGATFAEWKQADSPMNKRRVLNHFLAEVLQNSMTAWHVANFLTFDSRPAEALNVLEGNEPAEVGAADYGFYCAAYSRALMSMTHYDDALDWATWAAEFAPENASFQIVLADALHQTGQCEAAHDIYSHFMTTGSVSQAEGTAAIDVMFDRLFARDTGVASSAVLALDIVNQLSDPKQQARFWERAEPEFYYSPYFRMHHAYQLMKQGEAERSFAKLIALVQEMPWLKEANLNLERYFTAYDPTGQQIMPELQAAVRRRIQENGWTIEGMQQISVHSDGSP